jgi:hypothetical protein
MVFGYFGEHNLYPDARECPPDLYQSQTLRVQYTRPVDGRSMRKRKVARWPSCAEIVDRAGRSYPLRRSSA